MTPMQLVILIWLVFALYVGLFVLFLVFVAKHNIKVQIYTPYGNTWTVKSKRFRVTKDRKDGKMKLYPMGLKKKPWADLADVEAYMMPAEGRPVVDPKQVIKMRMTDNELQPFMVPLNMDDAGYIPGTLVNKLSELKLELWENTKSPLTKEEMLLKVALPLGLILLAICMLIFFPRIYEAIIAQKVSGFEAAKTSFLDRLKEARPLG